MRLSDVIARLVAETWDFGQIGHALTNPAQLDYPALLVTPVLNEARPPGILEQGAFSQQFAQGIGVWIMVQRKPDAATYTSAEQFDDLCEQVRAALAGWQPSGERFPMIYAGGRLAPYDTGIVAWREDFTIQTELRNT
jgi:hypothetical protein